jgi:hypothetical protein
MLFDVSPQRPQDHSVISKNKMNRLNKEYFDTKKKHKESLKKTTKLEKTLYLSILILIAAAFIFFNINKNKNIRQNKIETLRSIEFKRVRKDTTLLNNLFSILVPNNFGYNINNKDFLIFSKDIERDNFIYFVTEKEMIDESLIKSYEQTHYNSTNKYNYTSKFKQKNAEVLDLLINDDSKGLVKLIKLNEEKMYILHISSPKNIWDEKLAMKIINSFELN